MMIIKIIITNKPKIYIGYKNLIKQHKEATKSYSKDESIQQEPGDEETGSKE